MAAIAVVVITASIGLNNQAPIARPTAAPPVPSAAAPAAPTVVQLTVPNVRGMTAAEAITALTTAGFTNVTLEQNGAPPTARVQSQNPSPGLQQEPGDGVHLTAEAPPPVPHRGITAREWQLIAKSPDSHIRQRIIVYGYVTQFDAATGDTGFRASVDGVKHARSYEYDTNTILRGTTAQLANVVQGDMFRAEVTVSGSYTYETTLGGRLTAPSLTVDTIIVL